MSSTHSQAQWPEPENHNHNTFRSHPIWDVSVAPPPGGDRWTTWDELGLARGPEPWPDWLITSGDAFDTDLGVLKTDKEADVHLIERVGPDGRSCLLAAKRYRSSEHRLFRRDDGYQAGRRHKKSREQRAITNRTAFGRTVVAGMWARAEWAALVQLQTSSVRVPYPVSFDSNELLMEFIDDGEGNAAPRLAQVRPDPEALTLLWRQFREIVLALAATGHTHGDLSPYNLLVAPGADGGPHGQLVVIDLPQLVDVVVNPDGFDYLRRDIVNVTSWFAAHRARVDAEELFAEALAALY